MAATAVSAVICGHPMHLPEVSILEIMRMSSLTAAFLIIAGCVAELAGDYSGGNGGNGGNAQGDGMAGGNGGHGGPAFLIPPKMTEIGGVDAIGGTGGNGGNGSNGGPDGLGGNGGFRQGAQEPAMESRG